VALLLLAAIKAYRAVARPIRRRPKCLFAVSCSRHVERVTRERGFRAGIGAARQRLAACRPGYTFVVEHGAWTLECRNGLRVDAADTSALIRAEHDLVVHGLPAHVLDP